MLIKLIIKSARVFIRVLRWVRATSYFALLANVSLSFVATCMRLTSRRQNVFINFSSMELSSSDQNTFIHGTISELATRIVVVLAAKWVYNHENGFVYLWQTHKHSRLWSSAILLLWMGVLLPSRTLPKGSKIPNTVRIPTKEQDKLCIMGVVNVW